MYFLKVSTEGAQRMLGVSWFHRVGADTHKALSPKVLSLVRGTASLSSSEDLRDRGGGVGVGEVREVTGGPEREGTLNRMQNLTGKQWSCIGVGVMCCQGLMPVKTLAAGFCPYCSLSRV